MGLLNSFQDWKASRYEKKISEMQSQGICPDCHGKGVNTFPLNDYYLANVYDCPGCNGSGSFSDWATNTEQNI